MAKCKECGEETDDLTSIKVFGKRIRVCEDCEEILQEQQEIAEESEAAVQRMMEFKGRR